MANENAGSLGSSREDKGREKELAGRAAAKLVKDGDVVGLGTGSTAYFAIMELGERVKAGLKIIGIPTSTQTGDLARTIGIPLTTLDEHPEIDITIDGADEVDPKLRLIKGGGGALTREKVIASASRKMVVVADSAKMVAVLGNFPLPVEVIAFARTVVERKIAALGGDAEGAHEKRRQHLSHRQRESHSRLSFRQDYGPTGTSCGVKRDAGNRRARPVYWAGEGGARWPWGPRRRN